jgi:hypothetical protein
MEEFCRTQALILSELDRRFPESPFLALGQTVFWDEPMKAGVLLSMEQHGFSRRFVAGVHDTDYFAKSPLPIRGRSFASLPHNDTTTRGLWSAAGEFSSLFGSETVISRQELAEHGARIHIFETEDPATLDEATEAWGWRGVVSSSPEPPTTAELDLRDAGPAIGAALKEAVEASWSRLEGTESQRAKRDQLLGIWDAQQGSESLASAYREIVGPLYSFAAGKEVEVEASATTELLRFSPETAGLPRFRVVERFLREELRPGAVEAYRQAVSSSEIYPLDRFGAGATPFEIWMPGRGRGTLRLGSRGGVIDFRQPIGFSFSRRPQTPVELAKILEAKLGAGAVLIGKAVALIAMLAAEHILVMHEGASGYIDRSIRFHRGIGLTELRPILRIGYRTWEALGWASPLELRLPQPLAAVTGREIASGRKIAECLPTWQSRARDELAELGRIRRPAELIDWLARSRGGVWTKAAAECAAANQAIEGLRVEMERSSRRRRALVEEVRILKRLVQAAEHEKGRHFRSRVFEQEHPDLEGRQAIQDRIDAFRARIAEAWREWRRLRSEQERLLREPRHTEAQAARTRLRRDAERERIQIIRSALFALRGMEAASRRPAAWWLPLASPDGSWFRAAASRAAWRLEELC